MNGHHRILVIWRSAGWPAAPPFFDTAANNGWICGSAIARTDIKAYGFLNLGPACL